MDARTADPCHAQAVSAAAATSGEPSPTFELWKREVEALASSPEKLTAAARAMVQTVLLALAVDPDSDREVRRDVRRTLAALAPESVPRLEALAAAAAS